VSIFLNIYLYLWYYIVVWTPVAKRRLCKQRLLLGNALKMHARNSRKTVFSVGLCPTKSNSPSKLCYDRRSVGAVCLGVKSHLGPITVPDNGGFVDVGNRLWREDGSVVYNCCWSLPGSHSQIRVPPGLWPYFTSHIRDSLNLESQVPVFITPPPKNRLAQL
jgi:hypothetical protein